MIDPDKIYAYFEEHHGPLRASTNGWYDGVCPFCRSRKLAVNPELFTAKCWKGCFKGSVIGFVKYYLGCDYGEAKDILEDTVPQIRLQKYLESVTHKVAKKKIILPEGYHSILDGDDIFARRARNYLRARNFDLSYLDMIGVGFCDGDNEYFGYIIVPFKRDNDIVYFIGRDFMDRGDWVRYKNPPQEEFGVGKSEVIFNEEALYLFDKVYMLEGWTDAASIGNNAISIQGKSMGMLQWDIIEKSPVKEVVFITDLGAEKEGLNIVERLYRTKKTKLIKLTELEEFGKDVNSIGADRVLALEPDALQITDRYSFYAAARSINSHKKKFAI